MQMSQAKNVKGRRKVSRETALIRKPNISQEEVCCSFIGQGANYLLMRLAGHSGGVLLQPLNPSCYNLPQVFSRQPNKGSNEKSYHCLYIAQQRHTRALNGTRKGKLASQ